MQQDAMQFVVDAAGGRLDRLVARHGGYSRREARLRIAAGAVAVNRRVVRILTRPLAAGARVEVAPEAASAADAGPPAPRIVHLDAELVAVDKPAGLLSEPDRLGAPALPDLLARVLRARGEATALWLVHRLDAGTSGIMVLARTAAAARALHAAFAARQPAKRYLALCAGVLAGPQAVAAPLGRLLGAGLPGYRGRPGSRQAVLAGGKPARTEVRPLAVGDDVCCVEARPHTGRTHQIRVHLAHLGHPLLGDRLYGGPGYHDGRPLTRPLLHARTLRLAHPRSGQTLCLHAPVPADFAALAAPLATVERGAAPWQ